MNSEFREALEELLFVSPSVGAIARAMGEPVDDPTADTAYVMLEPETKHIRFAVNLDWFSELPVEQRAAVLAHETHHIVLKHLEMTQDKTTYPDQGALTKAQEVVINDYIEQVMQLPLPDDCMRGMDIVGQDCSMLSTYDAYKLLEQDPSEDPEKGDDMEGDGAGGNAAGAGEEGTCCGGFCDSEGAPLSDEQMEEFFKSVDALIAAAAVEEGISEADLRDALDNSSIGGYSPTGGSISAETSYSTERMNWIELLAQINPRVMEKGRARRKSRNNWTRNNSRMASVYPRVILPRSERVEPKNDDDGDKLPVFVIALDLSGSIDTRLVKTLQGMLNDIPEDKIHAFPATWGSGLTPYNEENKFRVNGGGTVIQTVSSYVDKIKAETGKDPYVLVITDGQFTPHFPRPGKTWYMMGVDDYSINYINRVHSGWYKEKVYHVKDFIQK